MYRDLLRPLERIDIASSFLLLKYAIGTAGLPISWQHAIYFSDAVFCSIDDFSLFLGRENFPVVTLLPKNRS